MKKITFLFALAFTLILAACGTGSDESSGEKGNSSKNGEKEQTLFKQLQEEGATVATSGTLLASTYYPEGSDELTGYDVEVLREIGKRLDIDISFEEIGVDGMLPALKNGRVDMAANDFEVTEERKREFAFSEPYKYSFTSIIVREDDLSGIETLEDVSGKVHGGGATTTHSQLAEELGAELKTYNNVTNDVYLRDVENGRTDFIINDYYLQKLATEALPDIDVKIHPDIKFNEAKIAVVLPQDADELKKKVDEAITEMREDGTLKELSEEFYNADVSKRPEEDIPSVDEMDL
ncbi:amino acid ABC transporter substrate-binding protein [Salimicrobium jeotgali]|uniref:Amino acid ABC transporter extracellular binding protein n=1 Tax=Salimicrobium jeotgali TaxID=1230341 RepID=K2GE38_9BACI|nr:transporter substrate-binding domain-containing protein [Salimicrobium jeotgali]AKG05123.1 amino acid ABC transporter substrate-binding protein [Salimicrobium jeotgali]EKE32507.1 amino acid ABC transporter extracellular binding protein [Salimicrobium jeotgali]MBM7695510.1 cystine transport system substrate-binding protein [Salimicrobium jeotgali]